MPHKGHRRKKTRTHETKEGTGPADETVPRSLIVRRGRISHYASDLIGDVREMMSPYTAKRLKEKRTNSVKDYVHVAGPLGITHLVLVSQSDSSVNMKIARLPQGPTLSFKVEQFSLKRQVRAVQKRPVDTEASYRSPPLLVLNNFSSSENHVKLITVTFQRMFPSINVASVRLGDCRRVVLLHYHKDTGSVEMRHYAIRAVPTGVSRNIRRIVQARLPDLSRVSDISELLLGGGIGVGARPAGADDGASDSEAEGDSSTHVTLAHNFVGRGNKESGQSAIKLTELGPRLKLLLTKVEKEICTGDVLYHAFVEKSAEEAAHDKARRVEANRLRAARREEQERNVARKVNEAEARKAAKVERAKARVEARATGALAAGGAAEKSSSDDSFDDAEVSEIDAASREHGETDGFECSGDDEKSDRGAPIDVNGEQEGVGGSHDNSDDGEESEEDAKNIESRRGAKMGDKFRRKRSTPDLDCGAVGDEDDDAEYYRQEVGEEPEPGLFQPKLVGTMGTSGGERPHVLKSGRGLGGRGRGAQGQSGSAGRGRGFHTGKAGRGGRGIEREGEKHGGYSGISAGRSNFRDHGNARRGDTFKRQKRN